MAVLRTIEIVWNAAREDALRRELGMRPAVITTDNRFDAVFLLKNEDLMIVDSVFSPDFRGIREETLGRVSGLVTDAVGATGLPSPPESLQARMTFLRILAERQRQHTLVGVTVDSPSNELRRMITGLDLLVNGTFYKCTYAELPPTATEGQQAQVQVEIKKRLLREVAFWKWASPLLRKAVIQVESHPDPFQLHMILESLVERQ